MLIITFLMVLSLTFLRQHGYIYFEKSVFTDQEHGFVSTWSCMTLLLCIMEGSENIDQYLFLFSKSFWNCRTSKATSKISCLSNNKKKPTVSESCKWYWRYNIVTIRPEQVATMVCWMASKSQSLVPMRLKNCNLRIKKDHN